MAPLTPLASGTTASDPKRSFAAAFGPEIGTLADRRKPGLAPGGVGFGEIGVRLVVDESPATTRPVVLSVLVWPMSTTRRGRLREPCAGCNAGNKKRPPRAAVCFGAVS
jgi:hypothetical protein